MLKRTILFPAVSAALFAGCGTPDPRDQVVYPYNPPVPRAAEYRAPAPEAKTSYASCPGDAEELAEGSICPPTAKCFEISGGKRCIDYEK